MNWQECIKATHPFWDPDQRDRFTWPTEGVEWMNCESGTTFSDVWGITAWILTYPGDLLLSIPEVSTFFEIEQPIAGHNFSAILAGTVIFLFLAMISD